MPERTHTGCIVNDVMFHVQWRNQLHKNQNYSIVIVGYHENEVIDLCGIIVDILELE